MFLAATVVSVLLAFAMGASGVMKLRRDEGTMSTLRSVGVPDRLVGVLAAVDLAAAVGLIVGIWVPLLGIAAAAGSVLYFLGAVLAHLRVRDGGATAAAVLLGLSVVTTVVLVLR